MCNNQSYHSIHKITIFKIEISDFKISQSLCEISVELRGPQFALSNICCALTKKTNPM